jgi:hypothetical protein
VRVELAGDALPAPHQLAVRPARERAVVRLGRPAVGLGLGGDDPVPDELMDVLAPANELRVLERRERLLVRAVQERLRRQGRLSGSGESGAPAASRARWRATGTDLDEAALVSGGLLRR